jgi:hypothetical protein
MKRLLPLLIALWPLGAGAAHYSTEATMSLLKDEGTLDVNVEVFQITDENGALAEERIAAPRIRTAPGVPAKLYTGPQSGDAAYATRENVTVEVSWPYPHESGTAFCAVTIRRGDAVVSKSRLQLKIDGPGRSPLILDPREIDPASVKVMKEKSQFYVLWEFSRRPREEVRKMALDNYGNKVRIEDSQGKQTDAGQAFGAYRETGMALQVDSQEEAERVAKLLRGGG